MTEIEPSPSADHHSEISLGLLAIVLRYQTRIACTRIGAESDADDRRTSDCELLQGQHEAARASKHNGIVAFARYQ